MNQIDLRMSCILLALAVPILITSCSKSNSSSENSPVMGTFAVTSPTASRSTTAHFKSHHVGFLASLGSRILSVILPTSIADTVPNDDVKPNGEMVNELKDDLNNADPEAIAAKIGNMSVNTYRVDCYGPNWTDNATGSSVSRPGGDLGMISETASQTDSTACAAAQLNALIAGTPQFANKIIRLQATLVASLKDKGQEIPAISQSADLLTNMPSIPGLTITEAKISRLENNPEGNPVYKTEISFTDASSKVGEVTVYHTPTNTENTNYTGLIQAILPHTATMGGTGTKRGFSMVYEQQDGVFTYALDTAANRSTDSSDFFDSTTGRIDYSKSSFGEDGNRIIASFNSNTNEVTMHYAWQAGSQDGAVRAFAANIPAGSEGSLTGVAYFGFGADISNLTDDVSTPWMTKMHCHWMNAQGSGPSVAKVQGQTFLQSSGKFIPDESKINFAPNDNCVMAGNPAADFTVSGSQPALFDGTRSGALDLTDVNAMGTIPSVTVPSYTIPSS